MTDGSCGHQSCVLHNATSDELFVYDSFEYLQVSFEYLYGSFVYTHGSCGCLEVSCVLHNATWLFYMCHDYFCLIYMYDMTLDSFICMTWLNHTCDTTHGSVGHRSGVLHNVTETDSYVTWLILTWHILTWHIHMHDRTQSCVWHDSQVLGAV